MSENTRELIKKYFNSLVQEFIKDPNHKDITIVFKNYIESDAISGDTLGQTCMDLKTNTPSETTWKEYPDGTRVPGSERTTYGSTEKRYTYTIQFLNNYKDTDQLRGTVVHEFSHLWLYSKSDNRHDHNDTFYSKMDYFEDWLDKKWNLSPRKDKGGDWQQHVDYDKRKQREKQYPTQSHNNGNHSSYSSYRDTPEGQKHAEFSHLIGLIQGAITLTELEQNYQTVKKSSLYNSGEKIKIWELEDIKEILDKYYTTQKRLFCTNCLNREKKHQSNCPNKCSKCSDSHLRNDTEKCHNIDCENYCFDPKWDRERKEREKLENSFNQKNPSQDQNKQENSNRRDTLSNKEKDEFNRLFRLIKSSKNLTELEQNYRTVKSSSIYSSGKRFYSDDKEDVKTDLDKGYNAEKKHLQSPNSSNPNPNPTPSSFN